MLIGELWPFQESAVKRIQGVLSRGDSRGVLVQIPTGHGKTFIVGEVLSQIWEENNNDEPASRPELASSKLLWKVSHHPILYVTAASVVKQTQRDLEIYFGLDETKVLVTSYSAMIASFGEKFATKVFPSDYDPDNPKDGQKNLKPDFIWHKFVGPRVLVFDECHRMKNRDSSQTKMGKGAALDLIDSKFIFMSATPFTSPIEAEVIARSMNLVDNKAGESWEKACNRLCDGYEANTYDIYAMENFRKSLAPFTVKIPHIRTKFKNHVRYELIDFETPEKKARYDKAFEDYVKELAQCGKSPKFGRKLKLVATNKFRERAEELKADYLAKDAFNKMSEGFQVTIACNFQTTIAKIVTILVHKYGVSRDKISLIWGGGDKFTSVKNELGPEQIFEIFAAALQHQTHTPSGVEVTPKLINSIHKQIKQNAMGLAKDLQDDNLRLGSQSPKERQSEIDKYQSGETRIGLYTFKAGSVGLSLHHCEDFYSTRPKRYYKDKHTGKWISLKPEKFKVFEPSPRAGLSAPTWSAIEVIQSIGRPHRLTSQSDTHQRFIYFRGTVEQEVAAIAAPKLESLATLTKMNECWMNLISEERIMEIASLGDKCFEGEKHNFDGKELVTDSIIEVGDESEEDDESEDGESEDSEEKE